jgi:hypothetical protein
MDSVMPYMSGTVLIRLYRDLVGGLPLVKPRPPDRRRAQRPEDQPPEHIDVIGQSEYQPEPRAARADERQRATDRDPAKQERQRRVQIGQREQHYLQGRDPCPPGKAPAGQHD